MDEENLKPHPVKFYEKWVLELDAFVHGIDFPIRRVNWFMVICTKIFLDKYKTASQNEKLKLDEELKKQKKDLVDNNYLPKEKNER